MNTNVLFIGIGMVDKIKYLERCWVIGWFPGPAGWVFALQAMCALALKVYRGRGRVDSGSAAIPGPI